MADDAGEDGVTQVWSVQFPELLFDDEQQFQISEVALSTVLKPLAAMARSRTVANETR